MENSELKVKERKEHLKELENNLIGNVKLLSENMEDEEYKIRLFRQIKKVVEIMNYFPEYHSKDEYFIITND